LTAVTGVSQLTQSVVALSVSLKSKCIRSTKLRFNHLVTCSSRNNCKHPDDTRKWYKFI